MRISEVDSPVRLTADRVRRARRERRGARLVVVVIIVIVVVVRARLGRRSGGGLRGSTVGLGAGAVPVVTVRLAAVRVGRRGSESLRKGSAEDAQESDGHDGGLHLE